MQMNMIMKRQIVTNNYILQSLRNKNIHSLATEYLYIIAMLYGSDIESGSKQVIDFNKMTMLKAENELRIRAIMMHAERIRRKNTLTQQHKANEEALLQRMKQLQNT
jgi:hypothetical protein